MVAFAKMSPGKWVGFASFLLMPQPPLLRKEGNKRGMIRPPVTVLRETR